MKLFSELDTKGISIGAVGLPSVTQKFLLLIPCDRTVFGDRLRV